jgi:hypothetical protein
MTTGGASETSAARRTFWLERCEGFAVQQSGRRVGIVESLTRTDGGDVAMLSVVGGLFGTRRLEIPVRLVADVDPARSLLELGRPTLERPAPRSRNQSAPAARRFLTRAAHQWRKSAR